MWNQILPKEDVKDFTGPMHRSSENTVLEEACIHLGRKSDEKCLRAFHECGTSFGKPLHKTQLRATNKYQGRVRSSLLILNAVGWNDD